MDKYNYLKHFCHNPNAENEKDKVLVAPFNSFGPLYENEIEEAEIIIQKSFPSELVEFYKNIGVGKLMKPYDYNDSFSFSGSNEIISPIAAANFSKGILFWDGQTNYMAESSYEDLEPGDLPFFEIADSSSFLLMKLNSDNPNAVWRYNEKIEDSFERFIWRLYYEDPAYYSVNW